MGMLGRLVVAVVHVVVAVRAGLKTVGAGLQERRNSYMNTIIVFFSSPPGSGGGG